MRSTTLASIVIVGTALLVGCANPPTKALDDARTAMEAARTAQAPDYAPETWNTATDLENKLAAEAAAQEKRFPLFRSYTNTETLAAQVKETADQAASEAVAGKERARGEADTLMTQAHAAYDAAKKALDSAPKGKGSEADVASLRTDSGGIETTLQEMQHAYDAGNFLEAKTKAQAAIDAAERIQSEIENARGLKRSAQRT